MKKTLIIFLTLTITIYAGAQSAQRQKQIHVAAMRIAEQIEVPESSVDAFVTLYQKYKGESYEIVRIKAPSGENPEITAELKILDDFEKGQKILALRKAYYFKFREIITASQIQRMYDIEKAAASKGAH